MSGMQDWTKAEAKAHMDQAIQHVRQMIPHENDPRVILKAALVLCKIKYGEQCRLGSIIQHEAEVWDAAAILLQEAIAR